MEHVTARRSKTFSHISMEYSLKRDQVSLAFSDTNGNSRKAVESGRQVRGALEAAVLSSATRSSSRWMWRRCSRRTCRGHFTNRARRRDARRVPCFRGLRWSSRKCPVSLPLNCSARVSVLARNWLQALRPSFLALR